MQDRWLIAPSGRATTELSREDGSMILCTTHKSDSGVAYRRAAMQLGAW